MNNSSTRLTAIVAVDLSRGIGKNNTIPWNVPEDMQHFKSTTMGGIVIMGANTWESLGKKPLSGRMNIVVSSRYDPLQMPPGSYLVRTPEKALELAHTLVRQSDKHIYVIGGQKLYTAFLDHYTHAIITVLPINVQADTFFPILPGLWTQDQNWSYSKQTHLGEVKFQYLYREKTA